MGLLTWGDFATTAEVRYKYLVRYTVFMHLQNWSTYILFSMLELSLKIDRIKCKTTTRSYPTALLLQIILQYYTVSRSIPFVTNYYSSIYGPGATGFNTLFWRKISKFMLKVLYYKYDPSFVRDDYTPMLLSEFHTSCPKITSKYTQSEQILC